MTAAVSSLMTSTRGAPCGREEFVSRLGRRMNSYCTSEDSPDDSPEQWTAAASERWSPTVHLEDPKAGNISDLSNMALCYFSPRSQLDSWDISKKKKMGYIFSISFPFLLYLLSLGWLFQEILEYWLTILKWLKYREISIFHSLSLYWSLPCAAVLV